MESAPQNFIPFYNECRDDPECENEPGPIPDYGTEEQTRIIDGSGVYVTRNENYKVTTQDLTTKWHC